MLLEAFEAFPVTVKPRLTASTEKFAVLLALNARNKMIFSIELKIQRIFSKNKENYSIFWI